MIYRLVYVSRALIAADTSGFRDLSIAALVRNAQLGITGFLYHDEGIFIQELEGVQRDVEAVFASIQRDKRHKDVRVILRREAETRAFGEWSMAFHNGARDRSKLQQMFGENAPDQITEENGEDVLQFLRDLAIGREKSQLMAKVAMDLPTNR